MKLNDSQLLALKGKRVQKMSDHQRASLRLAAKAKIAMPEFPGWKGEPYPKPLVRYTEALPIGSSSIVCLHPSRLNPRRPIPISSTRTVRFSFPEKTQRLIPAFRRQRSPPRFQAGGRQVRPLTPRPPKRKLGHSGRRRRNVSLTEDQLAGRGNAVSLFRAVRDQLLLTPSSESSPSPRSSPSSPPHRCRRTPPAYLTRRYVTQLKLYQALSNERKKRTNQGAIEGNLIRKAASCRHVEPPLGGGEGVSSCSLCNVTKRKRSPQSGQQPPQPPARLARRSRARPWHRRFDSSLSSDGSPILDSGQSPHLASPETPDGCGPVPGSSTPRHSSMASQSPSSPLCGALTPCETSVIIQSFSSTPSSAPTTPLYPHSFTSSAPGTPLRSQTLPSDAPGTPLSTTLFSHSTPTTPLTNKAGDKGLCSAKESSDKTGDPKSRRRDRSHTGKPFGNPHMGPTAETLKVPEKKAKRKDYSTPRTPQKAGGTRQSADAQQSRLKAPPELPLSLRSGLLDCELSPSFFSYGRQETSRRPRGPAHKASRKSLDKPPSTSSNSYSSKTTQTADSHLTAKPSMLVPTTPTSAKYFAPPSSLFKRPPTPWTLSSRKTGSGAYHSPPPLCPKSPDTGAGQQTRKISSAGYNMMTRSAGKPWVPKTGEDLGNRVGRSLSIARDVESRHSPYAAGRHSQISALSRHLSPAVQTCADKQELPMTPINSGSAHPFHRPSSATSSGKLRHSSGTSDGRLRHSYQKPDTPRPHSSHSKTQPSGTPVCRRPSSPGRKRERKSATTSSFDLDRRARPKTYRDKRSHRSPGIASSELPLEKDNFPGSARVRRQSGERQRRYGERTSLPKTRAERNPEESFRGDKKAKASKGQELFKAPFPRAPSHKLPDAQRSTFRRNDTHRNFKNTRSPPAQSRLEEFGDHLPLQPPSHPPPLMPPCLPSSPTNPNLFNAIVSAITLLMGLSSISCPQLYPAPAVPPATPSTVEPSLPSCHPDPGPSTSITAAGPAWTLSDSGTSLRSTDTQQVTRELQEHEHCMLP